jgi:hypothetical protein
MPAQHVCQPPDRGHHEVNGGAWVRKLTRKIKKSRALDVPRIVCGTPGLWMIRHRLAGLCGQKVRRALEDPQLRIIEMGLEPCRVDQLPPFRLAHDRPLRRFGSFETV